MNDNDNIFEELEEKKLSLKDRLKHPKFWIRIIIAIVGIICLSFIIRSCKDSWSPEELVSSVKIEAHDSRWVNKSVTPYEVTIVPSITFKVKNIGTRPMSNVTFNGVFIFKETGDTIGDGVTRALKKPLLPGATSEEIFLKSLHGYKASSKAAFFSNKEGWKQIDVQICVRINSGWAKIGTYPIQQEIEGLDKKAVVEAQTVDTERAAKTKQLGDSVQISSTDSYWFYKIATAKEVVIIPAIKIRVKNVGNTPLHHVAFNGDFEDEETRKQFSHGTTLALKKPLSPGHTSDEIDIAAEFGYSETSIEELKKNKNMIKKIKVRLFARTKTTDDALLGTYQIKRVVKSR